MVLHLLCIALERINVAYITITRNEETTFYQSQ